MLELQQKTSKKIQGLCLLSLSPLDMLFLFVLLMQATQFSHAVSFSRRLLKKCNSESTFVLMN